MPFIYPAIFWIGLSAVAVPIIIHLLNRRRFKVMDWAAMKFLLDSVRKNRRRLQIEELILLALRCLVVFLLGAGIARYTGCSAMNVLPGGSGSQAVVYILDDSGSMGQKLGAANLFVAATAELTEQIRKHKSQDKAAVILTSRPDPSDAFYRGFVTEPDTLAARLGALQPSDLRAHLGEAIDAAAKILREEVATTKRVVILSDFRRNDLAAGEAEAFRKRLDELTRDKVEVVVLDYGREARNNLTLQSMEMVDKFAVARAPVRVRVSVKNNGTARADGVEIVLKARYTVDSRPVDQDLPRLVIEAIDPGETRSQEFTFAAPQPGSAVLTAVLPADELPGDNNASLAMNVRSAIKVLVVDGRPNVTAPEEGESFFFSLAIDPRGDGSQGIKADVITRDSLAGVNFAEYDLVALLNLADFPAQAPEKGSTDPFVTLASLEQYVREGGGLAIFTGDAVNLDFYRKRMYAEGRGLLPLPMIARVGESQRQNQVEGKFFRLDPRSIAPEYMLRCFRDEAAAMTNLIRFFAFHKADEAAMATAAKDAALPRVLARFTDQDNSPAIVWREFGKGNVLTFYTTASDLWNDWPSETAVGTYVQVVLDMVTQLARRQVEIREPLVGTEIVYELPDDVRDAKAILKTPKYPAADVIPLAAKLEKGRNCLRYSRVTQAGVYAIDLDVPGGGTREIYFARNADPAEGVLTPGHQSEIKAAAGKNEVKYYARWESNAATTVESQEQREYWTWALVAMLLFLALETFLGQRFGHYS